MSIDESAAAQAVAAAQRREKFKLNSYISSRGSKNGQEKIWQ
jgi:hypothetical protein